LRISANTVLDLICSLIHINPIEHWLLVSYRGNYSFITGVRVREVIASEWVSKVLFFRLTNVNVKLEEGYQ